MAQTSTTLSGEVSHKADITGTDISISTSGTISSTGTVLTGAGKFAVRDRITVSGTANNNKTFTVKAVVSTTEFTVEETVTTGDDADGSTTFTLDHTGFVTDKAQGDGYYSQPDGVHTVAYHPGATINDDSTIGLIMQGSLATDPTEDDWFDITGTEITDANLDGSTLAFHANFTGNFVWVRAKITGMTAGAVTKILYNH
tara:strand:+ start:3234 stop:3833 length:600 start_codon:yes stop_codon:yes gene_type:complete